MKAIFDKHGNTIAWLQGHFAFDLNGKQLNLYRDYESVFTMDGKYLGFFSSGFFRDRSGYAVSFIKGATVGPDLPALLPLPMTPALVVPVFPPLPPLPPYPVAAKLAWSTLSWRAYLSQ